MRTPLFSMRKSNTLNKDNMNCSQSRLRFRELKMDDAKRLYEVYSDKEAMKFRGSKPMETLEDAKEFIRNQRLVNQELVTVRQGVESLKEAELIGSIMYRFNRVKKNECEIGYSIGRKFWGQGFGNEIVKLMVETLKKNTEIENVIAWSNKANIPSIKILEKNGFTFIEQEGQPSDNYLLGLHI